MGGLNAPKQTFPPESVSPDASDVALQAARRARAMSLLALGSNGNFKTPGVGLGTQATGGALTYGAPIQSLLGTGQVGDDTGTTTAPDLRTKTRQPTELDIASGNFNPLAALTPIDPNNPNK